MGLAKVFAVKGKDVFIFANGNVRKFGKLEEKVSTCVDDFDIAGEPSFVDMIS